MPLVRGILSPGYHCLHWLTHRSRLEIAYISIIEFNNSCPLGKFKSRKTIKFHFPPHPSHFHILPPIINLHRREWSTLLDGQIHDRKILSYFPRFFHFPPRTSRERLITTQHRQQSSITGRARTRKYVLKNYDEAGGGNVLSVCFRDFNRILRTICRFNTRGQLLPWKHSALAIVRLIQDKWSDYTGDSVWNAPPAAEAREIFSI